MAHRIKDLLQKTWYTEIDLITSDNGKTEFRGLYCDYDVEIEVDGKKIIKTVSLKKTGDNRFILEI